MPTILTSSNSEGSRRCDSTCHNAKHPKCACICRGRYHGRGTVAAQEQLAKDWFGENSDDVRATMEAEAGGELKFVPTQLELQLSRP